MARWQGLDNATKVIRDLTAAELNEWLEQVPGQRAWRFRRALPTDATRTRELQKLRRIGESYLEHLGSRTGVQLDLNLPSSASGDSGEPEEKAT